ncbi:hypothetical protein C8N43_2130 [Litoreibacter ponti]|uniref:Uncharacterized protein n=1 Tax=Litoreibacter ponti TaxID=1510457 RepID=A0A2T6BMZ4_9RHOB|nr:argininosuccinate lyase [Litoreibacter ponti]PTX57460.1 hypothetical protein C8N43_2130 [Litoreibacter ponti]
MRATLTLITAALLAACGVDGEPETPTRERATPEPGISITGRAEVGVAKSW